MNCVGIDWAYGRAAWCVLGDAGAIDGGGLIAADEGGLSRLALELGAEVRGCVEMMSGAIWVKDQLERAGWSVEVAHAREVRDIAPLAGETDKVDARVLAELCRRELVPAVWVACQADRADPRAASPASPPGQAAHLGAQPDLRAARAVRPASLVYPPATARCPGAARASRHAGGRARFGRRASGRDRRARPKRSPRATTSSPRSLAQTRGPSCCRRSPGVGALISLTFASEIGDVCRFSAASKLVGYAGLAPRISQSGQRSVTGRLSKAGSRTLRWAAVKPANQARRPSNPFHEHYRRLAARHEKEPGEVLARPPALDPLLAHALARSGLPTTRSTTAAAKLLALSGRPTALHEIERSRQLPATIRAPKRQKRNEHVPPLVRATATWRLDSTHREPDRPVMLQARHGDAEQRESATT